MPSISVIVPVYKAEAYLTDCVESILSQTFSDFEILLVDDGSPDGSGMICDDYAARYENITAIHQENRGQAAARNHAMQYAQGNWICFVDSDDLIHPQMLQLLWDAARTSGASIAQCGYVESVTLPENFLRQREESFEVLPMDEGTLVSLHDAGEYPGWIACTKLIRRELIEDYPFREGRVYEDNEAVCRWICQAGSLARTKEELYFYRGNPDSTTKSDFSLKRLDYLWALESIIGHYRALGYEKMRQRFAARYIDAAIHCCQGARYLLDRPDVVKQIEKQTRQFLRRENIKPTFQQKEAFLEVTHPKQMPLYWLGKGIRNRLRRCVGKGDCQ